jgi:hypothetical protein
MHLLVGCLLSSALAIGWTFFGDVLYGDWLRSSWLKWFGEPWRDDGSSIAMISSIILIPAVVLLILGIYLGSQFAILNAEAKHRTNLKALANARNALQQGLLSLDTIEEEYKHRLSAFEKLQKNIDELESVRGIDVDDLRKKLGALAQANRRSVWFERLMGFVLGIIASVVATFITGIL